MNFCAEIVPGGQRFDIANGETILDAALRAGIALEYGCRHGNCSSCKYLLTEGDVDHGEASIYSLTEDERDEGYALVCCARPKNDLVIEARIAPDPRAKPLIMPRELDAEVVALAQVSPALWQLTLAPAAPLEFHAGQFVELTPPWAHVRRSYSIASGPQQPERLDFIIKRVPSGRLSGPLPEARPGMRFKLRGPFGTSYLRAGSAPVLLCSTGSGIAPALAMLAHAAATGDPREFRFFYGARTASDLPRLAALERCAVALGGRLDFIPTLTAGDGSWTGRQGRVTQIIHREIGDARGLDAYLCGAPAMCDAVGTLLEAKGIGAGHLFYDRFHPAS